MLFKKLMLVWATFVCAIQLNAQLIVNGDTLTGNLQQINNSLNMVNPSTTCENRTQDRLLILPGIQYETGANQYYINGLGINGKFGAQTIDQAPTYKLNNLTLFYDLIDSWEVDYFQTPHYLVNGVGLSSRVNYLSEVDTTQINGRLSFTQAQISSAISLSKKWSLLLGVSYDLRQLSAPDTNPTTLTNQYFESLATNSPSAESLIKLNFQPNNNHQFSFTHNFNFSKANTDNFQNPKKNSSIKEYYSFSSINWQYQKKKLWIKSGVSHAYENLNRIQQTSGTIKNQNNIHFLTSYAELNLLVKPKHKVTAGVSGELRKIPSGSLDISIPISEEESVSFNFDSYPSNSISNAVYVGDAFEINNRISLDFGLKYWHNSLLAPTLNYTIDHSTIPIDQIDTVRTSGPLNSAHRLNPWLDLKFELTKSVLISAHYFSGNNALQRFRENIWRGQNQYVRNLTYAPPSTSIQATIIDGVALKYQQRLRKIQFSLMGFYHQSKNQFHNETTLYSTVNYFYDLERTYTSASENKGGILTISKSSGKLRGWFSYSFSNSNMKRNYFPYETVYGKYTEQQHLLSIAAIFDITKLWNISANGSFISGQYTIPNQMPIIVYLIPTRSYSFLSCSLALNRVILGERFDHLFSAGLGNYNTITNDFLVNVSYNIRFKAF